MYCLNKKQQQCILRFMTYVEIKHMTEEHKDVKGAIGMNSCESYNTHEVI